MAKLKVIQPFYDKYDISRRFKPGDVVDFDIKRAENAVGMGLCEYIVVEPPAPKHDSLSETSITSRLEESPVVDQTITKPTRKKKK